MIVTLEETKTYLRVDYPDEDDLIANLIDILGELPVKRALNTLGEETRSARSSGGLFVNGLTGGVTKSFSDSSKKVKEHTFFG